jgi:hypothetical protein
VLNDSVEGYWLVGHALSESELEPATFADPLPADGRCFVRKGTAGGLTHWVTEPPQFQ